MTVRHRARNLDRTECAPHAEWAPLVTWATARRTSCEFEANPIKMRCSSSPVIAGSLKIQADFLIKAIKVNPFHCGSSGELNRIRATEFDVLPLKIHTLKNGGPSLARSLKAFCSLNFNLIWTRSGTLLNLKNQPNWWRSWFQGTTKDLAEMIFGRRMSISYELNCIEHLSRNAPLKRFSRRRWWLGDGHRMKLLKIHS